MIVVCIEIVGLESQVVGNEATPLDPSGGGRVGAVGSWEGVADTNLMQVSSFQDTHHKVGDSNRGPKGHVRYPKASHSTMFH